MTADIAFHTSAPAAPEPRTDRTHNGEYAAVMHYLQGMSLEDMRDAETVWRLARAALSAVRTLQEEVTESRRILDVRENRIRTLERQATTDDLTGLYNRRGFMDAFDRELDRTARGQTKGGLLIMIDMDNFKPVNDRYGHAAGDAALRLVAQTLQAHIRKMDVAARIGGDEFVLLFSNADAVRTVDRVQKLARKLNTLTLRWQGERIPLRASLGIKSYAKGDRIDTIFDAADALMYQAKESRRTGVTA